jgi:DNA-binding response OmpR family regulator
MIIDNEMEIIQLIRLYLSREGYNVVWTTDGMKALSVVRAENPDLVLLDIVMPGISGWELCNKIREYCDTPIVFVSCKGNDTDKVLGLSIGGDDYITKPFSPAELVARVKAHLRRRNINNFSKEGGCPCKNAMVFNEMEIDLDAYTVKIKDSQVYLTAKEFELLALLSRYPNRVFTPKQIFDHLWDSYGIEDDFRTVMVHISKLRKKIEADSEHPKYIHTVRGVGYKFVG